MKSKNIDKKVIEKIDDIIDSQIGYQFLRKSASALAADLHEFSKSADKLSDEQLLNIVACGDDIKHNLEHIKYILAQRVEIQ